MTPLPLRRQLPLLLAMVGTACAGQRTHRNPAPEPEPAATVAEHARPTSPAQPAAAMPFWWALLGAADARARADVVRASPARAADSAERADAAQRAGFDAITAWARALLAREQRADGGFRHRDRAAGAAPESSPSSQ